MTDKINNIIPDDTVVIEINDPIINESKKVRFDEEKNTIREIEKDKKLNKFMKSYPIAPFSINRYEVPVNKCYLAFTYLIGISVVAVIYTTVNIELYEKYKTCQNDIIETAVIGKIINTTPTYITYSIGGSNTCDIINKGQYASVGAEYIICRSNSGHCAQECENNKCTAELILFNLLFTLLCGWYIVIMIIVGILTKCRACDS